MLNKIEVIGRVGNVKHKDNCFSFSVATDSGYGDKKKTMWHNIVCFKTLSDICKKYVDKGMLVYVAGELSYFETQDKTKVYQIIASQVTFLSKKSDSSVSSSNEYSGPGKNATQLSDFDDVPF